MELDPHVARTEVHVGPGVREQCQHAGVRDDDALGPAGRSGRVDHVRRVVRADLGRGGVQRQPVFRYEHVGRHARPGRQLREAVPLFPVHENDLRGGVGEDVLQPFVRVRQIERHVRAARGDDRDQGDDLLNGTRDGDGDPFARSDPGRAQRRGQLVLRVRQFAVGQRPGAAVETALGDGDGGRVAVRGGVEQSAQGRRGDPRGLLGSTPSADQVVRPGEQAGQGPGERTQDRLGVRLPQQFAVVDQVGSRATVECALHHERQRVVRDALVHDVGDDEFVARPPAGRPHRSRRRTPPGCRTGDRCRLGGRSWSGRRAGAAAPRSGAPAPRRAVRAPWWRRPIGRARGSC